MAHDPSTLHVAATGANPPWAIFTTGSVIVSEHPSRAIAEAELDKLLNPTPAPTHKPEALVVDQTAPTTKKRRGRPRKKTT